LLFYTFKDIIKMGKKSLTLNCPSRPKRFLGREWLICGELNDEVGSLAIVNVTMEAAS